MSRGCDRALGKALAFVLLCAAGCAEAPAPPATAPSAAAAGDPDAPASLIALPDLPTDAQTPRTHQAMLAARQTLDAKMPEPPADRSFASLQRWVDSDVVSWVERRRAQTAATRDRFFLEGEPSEAERIVSLAVIALLEEDTARSLEAIPPPSELDSEPDIAAMYRDITREQAGGFMNTAIDALRDCANAAYRGPDGWRGFAHYCHARFDRLRLERDGVQAAAPIATAPQLR